MAAFSCGMSKRARTRKQILCNQLKKEKRFIDDVERVWQRLMARRRKWEVVCFVTM